MCAIEAWREDWLSWSWSNRPLWVSQHEYWERNHRSLQEHQVFSNSEPVLSPWCCFCSMLGHSSKKTNVDQPVFSSKVLEKHPPLPPLFPFSHLGRASQFFGCLSTSPLAAVSYCGLEDSWFSPRNLQPAKLANECKKFSPLFPLNPTDTRMLIASVTKCIIYKM